MVWPQEIDIFDEFMDYSNSIHDTIKFTMEFSLDSINFLDTTVKVNTKRTLYTTLYTKPTDTHLYLLYESAHPESVKKINPYGQLTQFLKLRCICTLDRDFNKEANNSTEYYQKRGYTNNLLHKHKIEQVSSLRMNY